MDDKKRPDKWLCPICGQIDFTGITDKVPYGFFMDTSDEALNDWLGAHDDIRVTDKVRLYMMAQEEDEKRWNEFVGAPEDPDDNPEEAEESGSSVWDDDDDDWDVTGRAAQIAFEKEQQNRRNDLQSRADGGDTDAMREYAYGLLYENGDEKLTPEEAARCRRYLEAAAKAGNTDAMLDLGGVYISGNGVPADRERGLDYYMQALELGSPYAYHRLGSFYLYDDDTEGVGYLSPTENPDRLRKARQFFLAGTDAGHAGCLNEVGVMYMNGELGEPDPKKAFEMFINAYNAEYADPEDRAEAACNIAQCYHYATGTEKNLDLAELYASKSVSIETENKAKGRTGSDYFLNRYQEELDKILAELE